MSTKSYLQYQKLANGLYLNIPDFVFFLFVCYYDCLFFSLPLLHHVSITFLPMDSFYIVIYSTLLIVIVLEQIILLLKVLKCCLMNIFHGIKTAPAQQVHYTNGIA